MFEGCVRSLYLPWIKWEFSQRIYSVKNILSLLRGTIFLLEKFSALSLIVGLFDIWPVDAIDILFFEVRFVIRQLGILALNDGETVWIILILGLMSFFPLVSIIILLLHNLLTFFFLISGRLVVILTAVKHSERNFGGLGVVRILGRAALTFFLLFSHWKSLKPKSRVAAYTGGIRMDHFSCPSLQIVLHHIMAVQLFLTSITLLLPLALDRLKDNIPAVILYVMVRGGGSQSFRAGALIEDIFQVDS